MKRLGLLALALIFIAGAVPAARAQVLMRGDASYYVYRDRIRVNVEDITNYSDETTGRLRFMVWASKDPWDYYDRGRLIAFGLLPRLGPNYNLSDVRRTMDLNKPSTGWYYITVTLEERVLTESGAMRYVIRDKIEFDEQYYFFRAQLGWPFVN